MCVGECRIFAISPKSDRRTTERVKSPALSKMQTRLALHSARRLSSAALPPHAMPRDPHNLADTQLRATQRPYFVQAPVRCRVCLCLFVKCVVFAAWCGLQGCAAPETRRSAILLFFFLFLLLLLIGLFGCSGQPRLGNTYTEDGAFQDALRRMVPAATLSKFEPDLQRFGERVAREVGELVTVLLFVCLFFFFSCLLFYFLLIQLCRAAKTT